MPPEPQFISVRAYQLWEQEGRPDGRDQAHWFEAERQLQGMQRGSLVENSPIQVVREASSKSPRQGRGRRS
jgi:hypothetical protein